MNARRAKPIDRRRETLLRLCGRFVCCGLFCCCCLGRRDDRAMHIDPDVAQFLCERDGVDARADDERWAAEASRAGDRARSPSRR